MSSARYARLAKRLAAVGAPAGIVERARVASEDERRHAGLCDEAARGLGLEPPPPAPVVVAELAPAFLAPGQRVLFELLAFCCVSETLNATLLSVTLRHLREPALRTLTLELLRDEVEHARLGWAHLAFESGRTSCAFVEPLLVPLLSGVVSAELLAAVGQGRASDEALALGLLGADERLELIAATLRDVTLPGLRAAGIEVAGAESWVAECLRARGAVAGRESGRCSP